MKRPSQSGLAYIVQLNEKIKEINLIAHRINLLALNAILVAKRAGSVAVGFGVISNELRLFSQQLASQMNTLQIHVADCITEFSHQMRQSRMDNIMARAAKNDTQASRILRPLMDEHSKRSTEQNAVVSGLRRELFENLSEACRLCEFGEVISRAAKIEAAYAQDLRSTLTEISTEFDGYIVRILPMLKSLLRG